jgi:flagellar protein FlgJ
MLGQLRVAAGKAENAEKTGAVAKTDAAKEASYQKLVKVSRDFESIFLGYMLKTMRDTVPKGGLLDSSNEQEIFTSMHDEELAKSLSQAGGIGLGRMMVEQLKKSI